MAILDIREVEKEIDGIIFDDSGDTVKWNKAFLSVQNAGDNVIFVCSFKSIDNFVAALHKAKELAGK